MKYLLLFFIFFSLCYRDDKLLLSEMSNTPLVDFLFLYLSKIAENYITYIQIHDLYIFILFLKLNHVMKIWHKCFYFIYVDIFRALNATKKIEKLF